MSKILDNIDICMVYNYAYAQAGQLDYLYADENRHGQEKDSIELRNALLKINEELQGDTTHNIVYDLSTLEILKMKIEQLEWAHELLRMSKLREDNDDLKQAFKDNSIPYDLGKIKVRLGKFRTQYQIKFNEYKDGENKAKEVAEKHPFTASTILDNVAALNLVLEGKYIEARTTSMRDFANYMKTANSKIERNNNK